MGANITVKVPKGKDISTIIEELKKALHSMGISDVDFNVKQTNPTSKYNKPALTLDNNTMQLF